MSPSPAKKEDEICDVLEPWLEEYRICRLFGASYQLPPMYRITALRVIMSIKADKFDDMITACQHEATEEAKYDSLVKQIRQYAKQS